MDSYTDFRLAPDPEFTTPTLMNALFAKLHRAIASLNGIQVGVSFPDHQAKPPSLGGCLRVHGGADHLARLMSQDWLCAMRDYLVAGKISSTPVDALHCRVRRVQPKSSAQRLRRRYMKRHNVSEEEAIRCFPAQVEQRVDLPFLRLKSQSTHQSFRLFIAHSEPIEEAFMGTFNTYGFSAQATVPWF